MSQVPPAIFPPANPHVSAALPAARLPQHTFMQMIVDRNPFYLISAVLMFAGCRIIISALDLSAGDTSKLLLLIATLNVYEFALIGLALFLILRRGLLRDGWILLSIEALFLVDLTFLNSEVFTNTLALGAVVNLVCLALAIIKIAVVLRFLRLQISWPLWGFIALQLAMLLGMNGVFKAIAHNGAISSRQLYLAWWVLALLPIGGVWLQRRRTNKASARGQPMATLPLRLYVILPFIALLAHLSAENRVYWLAPEPANAAPVLLALAFMLGHIGPKPPMVFARVQVSLMALALIVSLSFPPQLTFGVMGVILSPLRLTLLVASMELVDCYLQHASVWMAIIAGACFGTAIMGHSVQKIFDRAASLRRWFLDTSQHLIPRTPMQWGITAVVASFLMLALGAFFSLRKSEQDKHQ